MFAPVKTELVEKLYDLNERFRCEHSGGETAPFLREAADEIMRLLRERHEAAFCHQAANTTHSCNAIKVPTSADEAAAMALIGHNWLKANAPDRVIEAMEPCEAQEQADRLHSALERARNILGNMALEHETGWRSVFARWSIHHEPLRADARGALPQIDAAIEDWEEARG